MPPFKKIKKVASYKTLISSALFSERYSRYLAHQKIFHFNLPNFSWLLWESHSDITIKPVFIRQENGADKSFTFIVNADFTFRAYSEIMLLNIDDFRETASLYNFAFVMLQGLRQCARHS